MTAILRIWSAALVIVLAVGFVSFLWPPGHGGDEIDVGVGAVLRRDGVVYDEERGVFLVWNDGDVIALDADARHTGDRVRFCWVDRTFFSPVHGSKLDVAGRDLAGPARGDLGRYDVRLEDGRVLVDLSTLELPGLSTSGAVPPSLCEIPGEPGFFVSP